MIGHILGKKPHDGLVDEFKEVRLRIGIVDNPVISRGQGEKIEPLNPLGAVNLSTGKICVRWLDEQGGVIRPPSFKGKQKYVSKDIDKHGQVVDVQEDNSAMEMLTLTHPMIWANETNWCGINYLPPVGSVVIVGFRRHGLPVLLGFLQSHYEVCNPIKLGEIMIKGYGKNYTHWKQSSRIEHRVWADKGDVDLDSLGSIKKNNTSVDIILKLDAHNQNIRLEIKDEYKTSYMDIKTNHIGIKSGGTIKLESANQSFNLS